MSRKIYVWGVDPQGLQMIRDQVADWAKIVELAELPERAPDGLLIVINNQEFNEWAEVRTMEDEIQPRPVLAFEPVDPSYDVDDWQYIDGYVDPDNWYPLENWLECPYSLYMGEMSADIPSIFFRNLGDRDFTKIPIAEIPLEDERWSPSDSPMRTHIAQCVVCRLVLNEAVEFGQALAQKFGFR